MKYTGEFKNINEKMYKIEFDVNNNITGNIPINLAPTPFVVDYNGGTNIYEPLKLSNATCTIIVEDDIITDLFSKKIHDVKCTLTDVDGDKIEWVGYATPCIYSQSFDKQNESLEIELIDGIATLEYVKFNPNLPHKKTYVSFIDLITNSIAKSNCYSKLYVSKNLSVDGNIDYNNLIEKIYTHEVNFVDDDGNSTLKHVLYSLMQFLNYTLIPWGDAIYIVDYEHIYSSNDEYTLYTTTNNWLSYSTTNANLTDIKIINADSFKKTGTKITLTDVKNKAIVNVENKVLTDLTPDFFDSDLLENVTLENGQNNSYILRPVYKGDSTNAIRFVKNSKIKTYEYSVNPNGTVNEITRNFYDSNSIKSNNIGGTIRQIANYKNNEVPSTLKFDNYLAMKRMYTSLATNKPVLKMFEYKYDNDIALLYDDYYFIVNTQINCDTVYWGWSPTEDNVASNINEQQAISLNGGIYIPIQIRVGTKYWNGTAWTTTPSTFKLYFNLNGSTKLYNKWYDVANQITYVDELDGEGQKIPISKNDYLVGDLEIIIHSPSYITNTHSIFIGTFWLKDFEINLLKKSNLLGVRKDESDTEYQNVINEEFVSEFEPIKLKLNTDVNKGLCFTSILLKNDSGNFELLNEIKSKTQSTKIQEYNIIQKHVELYQDPKKELTMTLVNDIKPFTKINFMNDLFVVDTCLIDYQMDVCETKILNLTTDN